MRWNFISQPIIVVAAIVVVVTTLSIDEPLENRTTGKPLPCEFLDSINITNGIPNLIDNSTIIYNNIFFPYDKYAEIDYVIENGTYYKSVEPYKRGCLCNQMPCVRLCCPIGNVLDVELTNHCRPHAAADYSIDVFDEKKGTYRTKIAAQFSIVDERPCRSFYRRTRKYTLASNGDIYLSYKWHSHREYCIAAIHDEGAKKMFFSVLECVNEETQQRFKLMAISKLISLLFLVATFSVYICLPGLQNLHGKCLICHLASLIMGYASYAIVHWKVGIYVDPMVCTTLGYLLYFSFISAFLWLSVISFDLWRNFRKIKNVNRLPDDKSPFIPYVIYAWGLSILLTLFAFIMDSIESMPEELQPGIGIEKCFLKRALSEFLYYYIPIAIITTTNLIFFILTAFQIHRMQREIANLTTKTDSSRYQKNLKKKKDSFTLFLRLFIVMGVTWSIEPIWAMGQANQFLFLLIETCYATTPLVIFVLFVVKENVWILIKERWNIVVNCC